MLTVTSHVLTALVPLAAGTQPGDAPPDDEVVAGWTGFAVFIGLVLAVAVLGYFLTKQLKRVDRAQAQGVFGDVVVDDDDRRDTSGGASDGTDTDRPDGGSDGGGSDSGGSDSGGSDGGGSGGD